MANQNGNGKRLTPIERERSYLASAERNFEMVKGMLLLMNVSKLTQHQAHIDAQRMVQYHENALKRLEAEAAKATPPKPAPKVAAKKVDDRPLLPIGKIFAGIIPSSMFEEGAKTFTFIEVASVKDGDRWDGDNVDFKPIYLKLSDVPEDLIGKVGPEQLFEIEVVAGLKEGQVACKVTGLCDDLVVNDTFETKVIDIKTGGKAKVA